MFISFLALALLSGVQLARGGTPLSLYTSRDCLTPSTTNPNITLELNVCAVTTGLISFVIFPTPCTSGTVSAWMFNDVACGNPASNLDWYYGRSNCLSTHGGAMAAVMLTCDADPNETEPSRPTSTTTIAVGPVANAVSSTAGGSSPTGAAPSSNPTGSTTTGSTGGGAADPSTTASASSGWNSLDSGTRIGIIVALAVGIPPIILGLLTLLYMKAR